MATTPAQYLCVRYRAAKAGLQQMGQGAPQEQFWQTRDHYYHYLQGMREMAYILGYFDEEENQGWMRLILKLYACTRPEDIASLPDLPSS